MIDDNVVVSFDEKGNIISIEIWRARELILLAFLQYLKEIKKIL